MTRAWLRDPGGRLAIGFALYGALFSAWTFFHWGQGVDRSLVTDLAFIPVALAAGVLALRASRRSALEGTRRAWLLIGLAFLAWWVADVLWFVYEYGLGITPFPSWSDALYLAFYPLLFAGLLCLPSAARRRGEALKLALDTATVVFAAAMVVWFVVIGPTARVGSSSSLGLAVTLAYPVADIVVIFALALVLLRRPASSEHGALELLTGGLTLFVVADLAYARLSLNGSFEAGSWPDAAWMLAECLMITAAQAQYFEAERVGARRAPRRPGISRLPYIAILVAYGLLTAVSLREAQYPLSGLILGAVTITFVVVARQVTVLRENARLLAEAERRAATDSLTGLQSRHRFFELADELFGIARHGGPPLATLMIDVDHFKTVNDTHGHGAGDLVLRALALRCSRTLRGGDVLGRYGGDEMAALLPGADGDAALAVANRLVQAVRSAPIDTPSGLVPVTLSIGVAISDGCVNLAEQLQRADEALYRAKAAGRDCARATAAPEWSTILADQPGMQEPPSTQRT